MSVIRLSVNKDVEALLEDLKRDFPALDYPEILKLALSDYHRRHMRARQEEERVAQARAKPRVMGLHQGMVSTSEDFDEPLSDEFWLGEE
ncbi:MAG: hypothetical protein JSV66_01355 [Trueperaceae bacterium]|nr:MAG: hypothetical protein JSV66_01355 [Trueperaceae bacterium]